MKNNLFYYATSELSQDAFICWLSSFALEDAKKDEALYECAQNMLKLFVPELDDSMKLEKVEKQIEHIDVLLTVVCNGKRYKIIVEDKTYTEQHDNQLEVYSEKLKKAYPKCAVKGVYYKTGFQSDLSQVHQAGYRVITRENILELMSEYTTKTQNQIFLDYYEYWDNFNRLCHSYETLPIEKWNWQQINGFYDDLKSNNFFEEFDMWMNYGYVANPSGGFDGMWFGSNDRGVCNVNGLEVSIYLQTEPVRGDEGNGTKINICLKAGVNTEELKKAGVSASEIRNSLIYTDEWKYIMEEYNFKKPKRLGCGKYMTLGIYQAECQSAEELRKALKEAVMYYEKYLYFVRNNGH